MSKSPISTRVQILKMLCEGVSMRATARMAGVSINTVSKLLVDAGEACLDLHDELVRGVRPQRVECDELWSFIHTRSARKANAKTSDPEHGDVWTWACIDSDSKLMISYLAGTRSYVSGETFMRDIASRIENRFQMTTDGWSIYPKAVAKVFGNSIDHATLVKVYSNVRQPGETRYAPLEVVGVKKDISSGSPSLKAANTSYVERANLTMRMGMRRYTRLTNGHSKKYANHVYALALFFMVYNFVRKHSTIKTTPAMAAGIADRQWTVEDIVAKMDERAPKPGPKGPRSSTVQPDDVIT